MDGEIHGRLKDWEKPIVLDNIRAVLFTDCIVSNIRPGKCIGSFLEYLTDRTILVERNRGRRRIIIPLGSLFDVVTRDNNIL